MSVGVKDLTVSQSREANQSGEAMMSRSSIGLLSLCMVLPLAANAELWSAEAQADRAPGSPDWLEQPPAPVPMGEQEVFAIDEDMRRFVREHVGQARTPEVRLRRLLSGMRDYRLADLDYSHVSTMTVRDTFHAREGNCLSFTMLFVALSREAGLDATYQIVDVPPEWYRDGDVVIVSGHINVLVRAGDNDYIVDFNLTDYRGNYDRQEVSDRYALGLFYVNRGVEAFLEERYETSYAFLRAATEAEPDIAVAWVNLGLLYARMGLNERSETAYLEALSVDRHNRSAMTNLVSLYTATGREEMAAPLRRRIRRHQERNPYHHFTVAETAIADERFDEALQRLQRAIRLKPDEHRFHYLRALVFQQLGQIREAERSLRRAHAHAGYPDIEARYSAMLESLLTH